MDELKLKQNILKALEEVSVATPQINFDSVHAREAIAEHVLTYIKDAEETDQQIAAQLI